MTACQRTKKVTIGSPTLPTISSTSATTESPTVRKAHVGGRKDDRWLVPLFITERVLCMNGRGMKADTCMHTSRTIHIRILLMIIPVSIFPSKAIVLTAKDNQFSFSPVFFRQRCCRSDKWLFNALCNSLGPAQSRTESYYQNRPFWLVSKFKPATKKRAKSKG